MTDFNSYEIHQKVKRADNAHTNQMRSMLDALIHWGGSMTGNMKDGFTFSDFEVDSKQEKEWGKNFFGDTYTGNNNPPDYSYRIENYRDRQAFYHDKAYDAAGAAGLPGILFNRKTLRADTKFSVNEIGDGIYNIFMGAAKGSRVENTLSSMDQSIYGWESLFSGAGMLIGTTPKSLYHWLSGEAFNYTK